jgi:hypothetical protein
MSCLEDARQLINKNVPVESIRHSSWVHYVSKLIRRYDVRAFTDTGTGRLSPHWLLLFTGTYYVVHYQHLDNSFSRVTLCLRLYSTKSFSYYCTGVAQNLHFPSLTMLNGTGASGLWQSIIIVLTPIAEAHLNVTCRIRSSARNISFGG